jgi:hypothetical protein
LTEINDVEEGVWVIFMVIGDFKNVCTFCLGFDFGNHNVFGIRIKFSSDDQFFREECAISSVNERIVVAAVIGETEFRVNQISIVGVKTDVRRGEVKLRFINLVFAQKLFELFDCDLEVLLGIEAGGGHH